MDHVKPGPKPNPRPAALEADGHARTRPRLSLTLSPQALTELQRQASEAELSQSAYIESLILARKRK
jgi:hypothetical protein